MNNFNEQLEQLSSAEVLSTDQLKNVMRSTQGGLQEGQYCAIASNGVHTYTSCDYNASIIATWGSFWQTAGYSVDYYQLKVA